MMEHHFPTNFKNYYNNSGLPNIISPRESKGLSNEKFQPPYTADKLLSPKFLLSHEFIYYL